MGHAGTLDPLAAGVLPVAVGTATRFTMASGWGVKTYWADVEFGSSTSTDDVEGAVIAEGDPGKVTLARIMQALPRFVGVISQLPPTYSALHIGGERAYRLARKGEAVLLKARQVVVDGVRVTGWNSPILSLEVQCHSGTYVRSLARDLGACLDCPSHLAALIRLRVGPFDLSESVELEALESAATNGDWGRFLWPADIAVEDLSALMVDDATGHDFVHGRRWLRDGDMGGDRVRVYANDGRFLGLAEPGEGYWQPAVVLEPAG